MKIARVLAVVLLAASGLALQAKNAKDEGFAGKWVLDKHSPRPGDAPNALQTKIKEDGSGFTIESTFKEPDSGVVPLVYLGVMTNTLHLNTDGQPGKETIIGPFTMKFTTTMNGNQMLTDWTAQAKQDQVKGHWIHTLASDGKHMSLQIDETSTQGQHEQATLFFVRK